MSHWTDRAACIGLDPEDFFPSDSQPPNAHALAACTRCPAKAECLQHALDFEAEWGHSRREGIFGGLTPGQRARLARNGKTPPKKRPPCGTTEGYRAHRAAGEPYCDACRLAKNAYERERYAARSAS